MAKMILPTNFQDDILNTSMGGKRRYRLINNTDGTISLEDVTVYDQVGNNFGGGQINQTNAAVNESLDSSKVIDDLDDIAANTQPGMPAGALAVAQLYSEIADGISIRYNPETHYIQVKNVDTWVNYDYFNPTLQSLVPMMTSNTLPSGVASSNNERYGAAYKAFDGNNDTYWMSDYQASNTGFHITYKFQKPVTIVSFEVMVFNLSNVQNLNANCILQVSRDGSVWENVHEFTTITTKELQTFENIKQIKDILYARIAANATFYYSTQNLKYSAGFSHIQYYGYIQQS